LNHNCHDLNWFQNETHLLTRDYSIDNKGIWRGSASMPE
jgi:hypothetical protein